MRILIDLGHPAHIHYFRNFISMMQHRGHQFAIVARDKEVLQTLLEAYNMPYTSRGKGGKGIAGKILYILKADRILYRVARKFKPDLFLSFASTYAAHVSRLCRRPHVALDDTEHASFELFMYPPFTDVIINPASFRKNFSHKQIFLNSFFELSYLHPRYFTPDPAILNLYGLVPGEVFFILRFVSWGASHDIGAKGISAGIKTTIVNKLSEKGRVIISSESELPEGLKKYAVRFRPEHLHHLLAFASLYLGEGATTASECVALGTPAIYVNSLDAGTLQEQAMKYGLVSLRSEEGLAAITDEFLASMDERKKLMQEYRERLLAEKTDPTQFLVTFIEGWPQSEKKYKNDPDFRFREFNENT